MPDYRHLIEAAPDGVVVSRQGVVLYANPAALKLLGYDDASELLGRSMAAFLSPDELRIMRERVMAIGAGARPAPRTYAARRRDGSTVEAEITSLPMPWDGEPAVIAFARDVTDRARLEAKLARSERLAAIGTLAAGLAHEINNPLTFATLGLDRLLRVADDRFTDAGGAAKRAEFESVVSDVRAGVDRIASIVRDLRAFARDGNGATSSARLDAVVADVKRLVSHEVDPRATLIVDLADLPAVRGEALRLEQVLVNLIVNAAQAFNGRSGDASERKIVITGRTTDGGRVAVEVVDNASGMSPEVLARAFDPFFTTKPGTGSGLGLWICHSIVTHLGGELTLESEAGTGTTARLFLPVADDGAAIVERLVTANGPASRPRERTLSVLVVDDEPALLRTVQALLGEDYLVEVASSGDGALERLLRAPEPDLVLCDLSMPGVTGADVFARIASLKPGLEEKMVFMTGGAFTPETRAFLDRVPNRRIEKPFSLASLDAVLRART